MANDNIFQQYLTLPKSVMDYTAEMDQADTRRNALQMSALGLQEAQMKIANATDVGSQRNALRAAVTSGQIDLANPLHTNKALMIAPDIAPGLLKTMQEGATARSLEKKNMADVTNSEQKTAAGEYELRIKKSDQAIKDIAGFNSPQDALASLQAHVAAGDVAPEKAQLIQQSMPQDPAKFSDWKVGMIRNIMSAKEQMQYVAPDANTVATNERVKAEGALNRANALKVQDMIGARQDKSDALLGPEDVTMGAQQYLAGDKGVLLNLGRGAQGAANIVAMRREITRQATAQGMTGADIAAKMAEFAGTTAGQRTVGTKTANVEMAADEAQQLIPIARSASDAVVRSGFLPFGKAQVMFDNNANDPALRQFAAANNALVNVYSRAVSPSGTPTVTDKEHAREMLSTAFDQKSYNATLAQMEKEIAAARSAPKNVRKAFSDSVTGRDAHPATPAAPSAADGGKPSLSDIFGH